MKEYKDKGIHDLKKLIEEKRESLREFRFDSTGSKIKNVKTGRTLRRDIARIMTEISLRAKSSENKV